MFRLSSGVGRPAASHSHAGARNLASSASREPGPAAHRWAPVAELLDLHRLPLAAVRDRVETEIRAHRVDVHEVVARVGHDAAVPVQAPELAVPDLVDPAGGAPADL